ncbi:MAG TPA: zinc ABC transporter substrate-binding protein [Desulfurivibrionaceae bacterium]|nr:zinc ABC transporter substrate-binding protein [Desulfurivibrionaceae bacterium]
MSRMRCFLLFCLLLLWVAPVVAAPRVVVTIKPIHSLVAGVMAGVGEPELLIKGGGSPHDYSLRPSDAKLLSRAELVVRVGADFETFLNRTLTSLAGKARVVSLDGLEGITMLPARGGGVWEGHPHSGAEEEKGHAESNLHLWLDPRNGRAIVAGMVKVLSELDPANGERYRQNGATLDRRLVELDGRLAQQLQAVADRPFVVFHDAYPYLEKRYNLRAVGSITVSPGRAVGARRLSEIRAKIKATKALCVFSEPQFEPKLAVMLTEGTGASTGVLDPEGAGLTPGPEAYFQLLEELGRSLRGCLKAVD